MVRAAGIGREGTSGILLTCGGLSSVVNVAGGTRLFGARGGAGWQVEGELAIGMRCWG